MKYTITYRNIENGETRTTKATSNENLKFYLDAIESWTDQHEVVSIFPVKEVSE